ncbi:MAG: lipoprotein [Gemmatimonadota bacterium]|nr:MAG: lipoprotein [Gemmatimonadota bacterium]
MNRSRRVPALFCGLLLFLGGCSSVRVTTDWDREVDFSRYRTFRWAPTQKTDDFRTGDTSLLDTRVRRAVVRELQARGLEYREKDKGADLLLVYRISSRQRVDVYRDYRPRRYHGRVVAVDRYREGSLVIMMVDPKLDQVVWEGAGVGVIAERDREGLVSEAVAKILQDYPPGGSR